MVDILCIKMLFAVNWQHWIVLFTLICYSVARLCSFFFPPSPVVSVLLDSYAPTCNSFLFFCFESVAFFAFTSCYWCHNHPRLVWCCVQQFLKINWKFTAGKSIPKIISSKQLLQTCLPTMIAHWLDDEVFWETKMIHRDSTFKIYPVLVLTWKRFQFYRRATLSTHQQSQQWAIHLPVETAKRRTLACFFRQPLPQSPEMQHLQLERMKWRRRRRTCLERWAKRTCQRKRCLPGAVSSEDRKSWPHGTFFFSEVPQEFKQFKHKQRINRIVIDPSFEKTNLIWSCSHDKNILAWDALNANCKKVFQGHTKAVTCIVIHENMLYSGSYDRTVRCWNIETGMCKTVYDENDNWITSLLVKDGFLYCAGYDCNVNIYDEKVCTIVRIVSFSSQSPPLLHMNCRLVERSRHWRAIQNESMIWLCMMECSTRQVAMVVYDPGISM